MAEKSVVRRPNYCKNTHQELPCEECGKTFTSVRRGHRFCSWECSRKYIRRTKPFAPKKKICKFCTKEFFQKTAWQTYCSSSCRDRWNRNPSGRSSGFKVCVRCGKNFAPKKSWNQTYCSDECVKHRLVKAVRKYRSKNELKGLCKNCSKKKLPNSSYLCEGHWFNKIARSNGILGRNAGEIAKSLLEGQNCKCPYTGKILIPSLNASIDHKNPKSRFPEQISLINNIEWVDVHVNSAKRNMTKEEFIDFCKLVASRYK